LLKAHLQFETVFFFFYRNHRQIGLHGKVVRDVTVSKV